MSCASGACIKCLLGPSTRLSLINSACSQSEILVTEVIEPQPTVAPKCNSIHNLLKPLGEGLMDPDISIAVDTESMLLMKNHPHCHLTKMKRRWAAFLPHLSSDTRAYKNWLSIGSVLLQLMILSYFSCLCLLDFVLTLISSFLFFTFLILQICLQSKREGGFAHTSKQEGCNEKPGWVAPQMTRAVKPSHECVLSFSSLPLEQSPCFSCATFPLFEVDDPFPIT